MTLGLLYVPVTRKVITKIEVRWLSRRPFCRFNLLANWAGNKRERVGCLVASAASAERRAGAPGPKPRVDAVRRRGAKRPPKLVSRTLKNIHIQL